MMQISGRGGGVPHEAAAMAAHRGLQVGEGASAGDRAHAWYAASRVGLSWSTVPRMPAASPSGFFNLRDMWQVFACTPHTSLGPQGWRATGRLCAGEATRLQEYELQVLGSSSTGYQPSACQSSASDGADGQAQFPGQQLGSWGWRWALAMCIQQGACHFLPKLQQSSSSGEAANDRAPAEMMRMQVQARVACGCAVLVLLDAPGGGKQAQHLPWVCALQRCACSGAAKAVPWPGREHQFCTAACRKLCVRGWERAFLEWGRRWKCLHGYGVLTFSLTWGR